MSKYGDYRHPYKGKPHIITVNHNLNKFSFLITIIHEVAHLTAWNKFANKVLPHGKQWKEEFKIHLIPFLELNIFPQDVLECVCSYAINPKASSCADTSLMKILKKYDEDSEFVHLEEIPESSIFKLKNGRAFVKGKRLRKRYLCIDTHSKRKYLISPVAEVIQTSMF